ncbi:MAG: glucose 1-dehydrogenase [Candidatus Bathyarchaeia archaeon]|jgi:NAD(P)-dependent dehydrogenase (short-subunit alcohol dehydrogenase family)
MGRLDGKIAVVTGATGGIGEASVRLFAAEGAKVVAADIDDERGKRLESGLKGRVIYNHIDVSNEADVKNVVEAAMDNWGRLDIMFNNAGIVGAVGPIVDVKVEDFDRTLGVNLRGAFLGIKHATPIMRRQGTGSIINTASTAALLAGFGNHIYSASKAGIVQLTRSVAMELGELGIRVNCVSPGYIPTPMIGIARSLTRDQAEEKMHVIEAAFRETQPLRGPIMPEEVAKAALFLASDDSKFITGQNLVVDGGVTGGKMWRDYQKSTNSLREALENR